MADEYTESNDLWLRLMSLAANGNHYDGTPCAEWNVNRWVSFAAGCVNTFSIDNVAVINRLQVELAKVQKQAADDTTAAYQSGINDGMDSIAVSMDSYLADTADAPETKSLLAMKDASVGISRMRGIATKGKLL